MQVAPPVTTAPDRARHSSARPATRRLLRRCAAAGWDADEVAAHLLQRQPAITRGLARRTPWAGLDEDTRAELYLSAAATVSSLAASGGRGDWRTSRDLERAVIAAFRHEALGHWKMVNAQKRISSAVSLIIAVTAELIIGAPGLGQDITVARASGAVQLMYALIITTGLVGWILNIGFARIERRALHWHPSHRAAAR